MKTTLYTSFRIKRETYKKLKKLRDKEKYVSIDEVINSLLVDREIINSLTFKPNE